MNQHLFYANQVSVYKIFYTRSTSLGSHFVTKRHWCGTDLSPGATQVSVRVHYRCPASPTYPHVHPGHPRSYQDTLGRPTYGPVSGPTTGCPATSRSARDGTVHKGRVACAGARCVTVRHGMYRYRQSQGVLVCTVRPGATLGCTCTRELLLTKRNGLVPELTIFQKILPTHTCDVSSVQKSEVQTSVPESYKVRFKQVLLVYIKPVFPSLTLLYTRGKGGVSYGR